MRALQKAVSAWGLSFRTQQAENTVIQGLFRPITSNSHFDSLVEVGA